MSSKREAEAEAGAGDEDEAKRRKVDKTATSRELFVFATDKAGMAGADKERTNRIIYDMSKGSAFHQAAERKAAATDARIARMKKKAELLRRSGTLTGAEANARRVRRILAAEEEGRAEGGVWIHVDMDMFYAAVEMRDNPSLRGRPVAVGSERSVISTSNYVARRAGVRSAMPGFIARRLCPALVFVPPRYQAYKEAAAKFRAVFAEYDPDFTSWSLDEAFLNVTAHLAARADGASPAEVAEEIRRRVREVTDGLTCSAGCATDRMVAKICSDANKPNGQTCVLGRDSVVAFMRDLPVRRLPGVGKVTEKVLRELGIERCGQVLEEETAFFLLRLFSERTATWLFRSALGISGASAATEGGGFGPGDSFRPGEGDEGADGGGAERKAPARDQRKSISVSRTFRPIWSVADLRAKVDEMAGKLAADVAARGLRGRNVTLSLKSAGYESHSRSLTLPRCVSTAEEIAHTGRQLLAQEIETAQQAARNRAGASAEAAAFDPADSGLRIRLLGLRLSQLEHDSWLGPRGGQMRLDSLLQPSAAVLSSSSSSLPSSSSSSSSFSSSSSSSAASSSSSNRAAPEPAAGRTFFRLEAAAASPAAAPATFGSVTAK